MGIIGFEGGQLRLRVRQLRLLWLRDRPSWRIDERRVDWLRRGYHRRQVRERGADLGRGGERVRCCERRRLGRVRARGCVRGSEQLGRVNAQWLRRICRSGSEKLKRV